MVKGPILSVRRFNRSTRVLCHPDRVPTDREVPMSKEHTDDNQSEGDSQDEQTRQLALAEVVELFPPDRGEHNAR